MSKSKYILAVSIWVFLFCLIGVQVNARMYERRENRHKEGSETETEILSSYAQKTQDYTGNVNIFYGQLKLNKNEWLPVDKQKDYGIEIIRSRKKLLE